MYYNSRKPYFLEMLVQLPGTVLGTVPPEEDEPEDEPVIELPPPVITDQV